MKITMSEEEKQLLDAFLKQKVQDSTLGDLRWLVVITLCEFLHDLFKEGVIRP